jgi:hypothetical protein
MSSNKTAIKRLSDLERLLPSREAKYHQIIVQEGEDADARIAEMIASGAAKPGDKFILQIIVSPKRETSASDGGAT